MVTLRGAEKTLRDAENKNSASLSVTNVFFLYEVVILLFGRHAFDS